jgi:UTP--glucose-1-phosphate uridylyltransferase
MTAAAVRTAVIPAAGLGTRFLPATKAVPKEMLTVVDRPSIQWVVEEAVAAGIDDIVVVTSPHKKPLEDHFDRTVELELALEEEAKVDLLEKVQEVTGLARFRFTRQESPLGLGYAVSMAARQVGDEPFAVLLPDELLADGGQTLKQMIEVVESTDESVVALIETVGAEISNSGCAGYSSRDGEIQLTDAMAMQIDDRGMRGLVIDDIGFDTGQKTDWLRANVELSLRTDDSLAIVAMLKAALESNGF